MSAVIAKNRSDVITPWPDNFFDKSILTNNNFIITSNSAGNFGGDPNVNTDTLEFIYSGYTLTTEDIGLITQNRKLIESIPLNLDYDKISSYVYFGKSTDFMIQEINEIISKFPASLYISNLGRQTLTTAEFVYFDPLNNYTHFEINIDNLYGEYSVTNNYKNHAFSNPYGVVYSYDNSWDTSLLNLIDNYTAYTITPIVSGITQTNEILGDNYNIIDFTASTKQNTGRLYFNVRGNPFGVNLGSGTVAPANNLSLKYHIKPNQKKFDLFFTNLTDFQKNILNRYTKPQYGFKLNLLKSTGDFKDNQNKKLIWPTSDKYNLDISTPEFYKYLRNLQKILDDYDLLYTDILYRRLLDDGIREYDLTDEEKISKYIRAWGWSYDKVKRYIDSISFVNSTTYNKKENVPDDVIKLRAKLLGWEIYLPFKNFLANELYTRNNTDIIYPGWSSNMSLDEIETELWRRFVINSIYFFKSKGTRASIESLMFLLGLPREMLKLNEYVYTTKPINVEELVKNLAYLEYGDILSGNTYFDLAISGTAINSIYQKIYTNNLPITPINNYSNILSTYNLTYSGKTGFPQNINQSDVMYFQNYGGWFESNYSHFGEQFYDSGKLWLDYFRYFDNTATGNTVVYLQYSGVTVGTEIVPKDLGFKLTKQVDNKKSWIEDIKITGETGYLGVFKRDYDVGIRQTAYTAETGLVINSKEVDMFLDFSSIVTTGSCVTTLDQYDLQIPWLPITPTNLISSPTYSNLISYIEKLDNFWLDITKQLIPATAIFRAGVIYSNCESLTPTEYYFYNFSSSTYNLHFLTPDIAISGDQFNVITDYVLPFSGYSWTEDSWLEYLYNRGENDNYNRFAMIPGLLPFHVANYGYPGIVKFPIEIVNSDNPFM